MRSQNYAYSIAFKFFHDKGMNDCSKLAAKAVEKYKQGNTLHESMLSLVRPESE